MDELLVQTAHWPPARGIRATQAIREASDQHQKQLEDTYATFRTQVEADRAACQAELTALREENAKVQAAASAAEKAIAERETRLDTALDDLDSRYKTLETGWSDKAEQAREKEAEHATAAHTQTVEKASAVLAELGRMQENANAANSPSSQDADTVVEVIAGIVRRLTAPDTNPPPDAARGHDKL